VTACLRADFGKGKYVEQDCGRVGNGIMATESQKHADLVSEPENGLS